MPLRNFMLSVLPFLAAASCCGDMADNFTEHNSSREISFEASLPGTRGQAQRDSTNLTTMVLFAGYEDQSDSFSSTSPANDYMDNVRYHRTFTYQDFLTNNAYYWPFTGKLSFFAYAPFIASTHIHLASDYVSGFPRITFIPFSDVTIQEDLCVASPVLDRQPGLQPVPLRFSHALCQVVFSANYAGAMPQSSGKLYIKIDSLRLCNVIGSKTFTMSNGTPCFEWQADSLCSSSDRTSYFLRRGGTNNQMHLLNSALDSLSSGNYLDLSTANGILYLLPQGMTDGHASLSITYGYYENVNGYETLRASVKTSCPLPAVTWQPARCYRYRFTINLSSNSVVNPTATVVDWISVDNNVSSPQHLE